MAVRMTHPAHGVTFAIGSEVEWNKAHGWKVEERVKVAPEPPPAPPALPNLIIEAEASVFDEPAEESKPDYGQMSLGELTKLYAVKFGRAPHHRMIRDTIIAALAEE